MLRPGNALDIPDHLMNIIATKDRNHRSLMSIKWYKIIIPLPLQLHGHWHLLNQNVKNRATTYTLKHREGETLNHSLEHILTFIQRQSLCEIDQTPYRFCFETSIHCDYVWYRVMEGVIFTVPLRNDNDIQPVRLTLYWQWIQSVITCSPPDIINLEMLIRKL